MRNVTQRGAGPKPAWSDEPAWSDDTGPVFPLTRKPPFARPGLRTQGKPAQTEGVTGRVSLPSPSDWPFDREPESGIYEVVDDEPPPQPATPRQIAVRTVGFLALAGALYGCAMVLLHPTAGRAALHWATFGHADRVLDVARTAGSGSESR